MSAANTNYELAAAAVTSEASLGGVTLVDPLQVASDGIQTLRRFGYSGYIDSRTTVPPDQALEASTVQFVAEAPNSDEVTLTEGEPANLINSRKHEPTEEGVEEKPKLTAAQEQLIERYAPLVKALAWRKVGKGRGTQDDLEMAIGNGYLGLVKAATRYDSAKVSTNATTGSDFFAQYIYGEISKGMRDWFGRQQKVVDKETGEVKQREGTRRLKPSVMSQTAASVDAPVKTDDPDGALLGDVIASTNLGFSDTTLFEADLRRVVDGLELESDRNKQIFLDVVFSDKTQTTVGEEHGLSQMQISRIVRSVTTAVQPLLQDYMHDD